MMQQSAILEDDREYRRRQFGRRRDRRSNSWIGVPIRVVCMVLLLIKPNSSLDRDSRTLGL